MRGGCDMPRVVSVGFGEFEQFAGVVGVDDVGWVWGDVCEELLVGGDDVVGVGGVGECGEGVVGGVGWGVGVGDGGGGGVGGYAAGVVGVFEEVGVLQFFVYLGDEVGAGDDFEDVVVGGVDEGRGWCLGVAGDREEQDLGADDGAFHGSSITDNMLIDIILSSRRGACQGPGGAGGVGRLVCEGGRVRGCLTVLPWCVGRERVGLGVCG